MWSNFTITNAKLISVDNGLKFSIHILNSDKELVIKEFALTPDDIDWILIPKTNMVAARSLDNTYIGNVFDIDISTYKARSLGLLK